MNKTYDENKQQKIRKQQQEKKAPETSKQPFLHHLQQRMGNQAVQRLIAQRAGKGASTLDEQTEKKIQQAKQSGQGMDTALQHEMEQKIGQPLRDVRLHTDSEANQLNQQLGARAFTVGKDIFFRSGTFDPNSQQGQQLLAHELTHVHQQESGKVEKGGEGLTVRPSGDQYEQEADAVAHQAVKPNASGPAPAGNAIQRESHWDEDLINAMNVGPHSSAPNRSSSEIAQAPAHNPNEVTPTERPQERNHTAEIAQAPANVVTQSPSNSENEVTPTERPQERNHTAEIAQAPANVITQAPSNSENEVTPTERPQERNHTAEIAQAPSNITTQKPPESNSTAEIAQSPSLEKPPTGNITQTNSRAAGSNAAMNAISGVTMANSVAKPPTANTTEGNRQLAAGANGAKVGAGDMTAQIENKNESIQDKGKNKISELKDNLEKAKPTANKDEQIKKNDNLKDNTIKKAIEQASIKKNEDEVQMQEDYPEEEEVQMARENSSSGTLQANFLTDQFENMWNTGKKYAPDSVKNMAGKAKKNITDKVGKAKKTAGGIWDNIGSLVGNKTESVGDIIKNSTGGSFNQTEGEIPAEGENQGWSQNEGSLDEEVQMQEEEEIVQCQEEWPEEEEVQLSEADAEEELVQCQEEEELAQFKLESSGGESLQMQGMEEYEKLMMGGEKEKFNKKEGDIPWWKRIWGFNS